jgi:hypothetical protein
MKSFFGAMVALGLLLLLIAKSCSSHSPAAPKARSAAPATAAQTPRSCEGPWTAPTVIQTPAERMLYRFDSDGCVTIHLSGNWSDYPKGGKISFTYLKTGRVVLIDKPGTDRSSSLPAGDYRVCKVNPDAWGVEIRW